jgi:hypothetical protein
MAMKEVLRNLSSATNVWINGSGITPIHDIISSAES